MAGPVLVFDSGVGGLSVVSAMRRRLPEVALAYACDNAMLPYGVREDDWLVARILAVCEAAVAATGCSALVVACNTASTLALGPLRERLSVPVVGTVPAIKPAAGASKTRHIGLLATSGTVSRPYTGRLIRDFAGDCRVTRIAADPLVGQAERLVAGESPDPDTLRRVLAPLAELPDLDTLVLGCTHFPLLQEQLAGVVPHPVRWVDSGDAIARRTGQVVAEPLRRPALEVGWVTAPSSTLARGLAGFGFAETRRLVLA